MLVIQHQRADDSDRLLTAIQNSKHLRGSKSITDLAFDRVEIQDQNVERLLDRLHETYDEIEVLKEGWCYRIKQWLRRAIKKA